MARENGREGRYDEVWRTEAVTASVAHDQGVFDAFENGWRVRRIRRI